MRIKKNGSKICKIEKDFPRKHTNLTVILQKEFCTAYMIQIMYFGLIFVKKKSLARVYSLHGAESFLRS